MFRLRTLATAALAVLFLFALSPGDAAFAQTWRMASKMPVDSPEGKAFQVFADKVAEHSNGRLTVEVFPSEQLGGTEATLEQLQSGLIHVYPEGSSFLQKWVPEMKWISAEFIFRDRDHWSRFMDSDMVKGWYARVEDAAGIAVIGKESDFVRGPFNVQVSSRPWTSLDEMAGIKLRSHNNALAVDIWARLGAEVRVMGWTDVYQGIDRGIVQAVNSPIALVEPMRFYEVAPFIIRHDSKPQGISFMVNAKAYRDLDPDIRAAVDQAQTDASAFSAQLMANFADESIARMVAKDVQYLEIDNADFIKRMAGFYEEMEDKGELPKGFLTLVQSIR